MSSPITSPKTIITEYRSRALLGFGLMATQVFAYNAIFFTYALVLHRYYFVPAQRTGFYLLPFALGNFGGPLLLGRLFDTIGRRPPDRHELRDGRDHFVGPRLAIRA